MSSLTEEWQIQNENGTEYKVSIKNLADKMKIYPPGKVITSRTFYVGECSFSLDIYPNGVTSKNQGNVSVFLRNRSNWRVRAECKFSVKNYWKIMNEHLYDVSPTNTSSWGFKDFLAHNRCHKDLLDDNETFILKAEIKLLEEEVNVDRELSANSAGVRENKECAEEIKKLTGDCLEDVRSNKKEIKKLSTEIDNLRRSVESMKISNKTEGHIPTPECPVCLEMVKRPMRLMQCGMGHILCDSCYRKSREEARRRKEGDRDMARCHTCGGEYTGRPAVMERMLGLLD